ncbi:hypothetical protein Tco_0540773 [Tanacetum coccineum]
MPMMEEKKPFIDLNAECSLEITEDVEVENIIESQTPDKFDIAHIETGNMNMSEHADQKMGGNYSYVGYRPTFSKVVGSEYGLRHPFAGHGSITLFNTGHTGLLEPAFACHFPRTKLIMDFENSAIRLPTINDDGGGSFSGFDICDNHTVMDFEHSRVYTLSAKGGVTNIASERYAAHSVCDRNQQKNYFSVPKDLSNEYKLPSTSTTSQKRNQKSYGKMVNKMVSARPCVRQLDGSQYSASQTDKKKGVSSMRENCSAAAERST